MVGGHPGVLSLERVTSGHKQYLYPQIGHDHLSAENVTWCQGEGCFSLNLTYDVPIQQIEALIAMSDVCEQEIKFEVFS